jgi:hypothetical protein
MEQNSMKTKTIWTDREKKFKPVNMQTVKIMFPAKGIHLPPPVPTETREQRNERLRVAAIEREKALREKIELNKREEEDAQKALEKRNAKSKAEKARNWMAKAKRREEKIRKKLQRIK